MEKYLHLCLIISFIVSSGFSQTVTDYDGNTYNTVIIGNQVWMKENLKVTHFNNGDIIPNVTDNNAWSSLTNGAYSNYNNDINNANIYGNLYNFYTVADSRKICPLSWHVPEDWEWNNLTTTLGGSNVAGGKLKETGTSHWTTPNTGATNESGFTCLPAGMRMSTGTFAQITQYSYLWASTDQDTYNAIYRWIGYSAGNIYSNIGSKSYGQSVRCIRDLPANINDINDLYKINIYPNPASDVLNIDQLNEDFSSVFIYNILGEVVLQKFLLNKSNPINIKFLPNGVYFIRLSGKYRKTFQQKMIKK